MLRALGLHGPDAVKMVRGHVRLCLLGPEASAGFCWRGDQLGIKTALCGAVVGSEQRLVGGLCFRAFRALRHPGFARHRRASIRRRGQQRVERFRDRTRYRRERRRSALARTRLLEFDGSARKFVQEDFWRIPTARPIRP